MNDEQNAKMLAATTQLGHRPPPSVAIEAVPGGFIMTRDRYWNNERREVVSSPDALVAIVQRWAREAHERVPQEGERT